MTTRLNRHAAAIAAALDKEAPQVQQRHATAWDVVFRNGTELTVGVELDDDWVRLETAWPAAGDADCWSLLVRNGSLPPGVKFAIAVGDALAPPVRLHAEVMLDDAAEPAMRMQTLCRAIKTAAHVWPAHESGTTDAAGIPIADAVALCRETAWPVVERDGKILVELDVPDGFAQAQVSAAPDGTIARPLKPPSKTTSASTVGFPLESITSLA